MKSLFIFVEGYYDQMFVENILSEYILKEMSVIVFPIPYAEKPKRFINKEIRSKSNYNYLLFADFDSNKNPCITFKKDSLMDIFSYLDSNNIIIVREEIESWFLAGIDNSLEIFKGLNFPHNTDSISKEDFNRMLEDNSIYEKEEFLLEVSKYFDFNLAIKRNKSFKYFLNK